MSQLSWSDLVSAYSQLLWPRRCLLCSEQQTEIVEHPPVRPASVHVQSPLRELVGPVPQTISWWGHIGSFRDPPWTTSGGLESAGSAALPAASGRASSRPDGQASSPLDGPPGTWDGEQVQQGLCVRCRQLITHRLPFCRRCGVNVGPFQEPSTDDGCHVCRHESWATGRFLRLGMYHSTLRQACLRSKQRGGAALAGELAGVLWDRLQAELNRVEADCVMCVPQHWLRRLRRDDHPAEILAECVARRLGLPLRSQWLIRRRRGRLQKRLSPRERLRNVRGAFAMHPLYRFMQSAPSRVRRLLGSPFDPEASRRVLLVDDVVTTGSTVNEVSRVLRRQGFCVAGLVAFARGLPRKSTSERFFHQQTPNHPGLSTLDS